MVRLWFFLRRAFFYSKSKFTKSTTFLFLRFLVIIYNSYLEPYKIRASKRAIFELPTSNRKKLLTFYWRVLSQKTTLFPFFGRSYSGNRFTYIAENLHRFFLGNLCTCAKFHRNRRGDSQTIGWSDTDWPMHRLHRSGGDPTNLC